MKLLLLTIFVVYALAEENYDGPEYMPIDESKLYAVEELPGFWDNRSIKRVNIPLNVRDRRIIGGFEANPNQTPFQVVMSSFFPDESSGICGGSILNSRSILTAAHCLPGTTRTLVIAGVHNRQIIEPNQQRRTVPARNYLIHQNYNPQNFNNDLAILMIPTPYLVLNRYLQPTRLPTNFVHETFVNEWAQVRGYGAMTNQGGFSDVLMMAHVLVLSHQECVRLLGNVNAIQSTLCAHTNHGKGPCFGDSGGPLTIARPGDTRPVQIGVVSFVVGDRCVGIYPSGYARLTSFLGWIHANQ